MGEMACTLATDMLPICEPDIPMMALGAGALPANVGTTAFGAVAACAPCALDADVDVPVVEAPALNAPPTAAGLLGLVGLNTTARAGLTACMAACCVGVIADSCDGVKAINWVEDKPLN